MRWKALACGCGLGLVLAVAAPGCARRAPQAAPAEPPSVPVSRPVTRKITDFVEFTGRTEAIHSVDIRPRSTGYLVEMPFKEGTEVKAGDLLFVIDPRPYKAQLDQAAGQVNLYQAQLKLAKSTLARDVAINRITPNAVSRQQLDQEEAAVEEAQARVDAYQKNMEVYRLNQEFTRVVSPIDGMVSRYFLTLGNLVNQDQTLLTTVVSLDPMYAYFDVDEPTLLQVRRAINEGRIRPRSSGRRLQVFMGLQGEAGFPHEGEIDFINNQVNPTTGSILLRGIFANPKPPNGVRVLSPGMFVRIRLPIGEPHDASLVIDRAILSDQGIRYVFVVGPDRTVEYRRVTTGALQEDGLRVITQGLKGDESVVVGGLQQVSAKAAIVPEEVPMPSLAQPAGDGTGAGAVAAPTSGSGTAAAPGTTAAGPPPAVPQGTRKADAGQPAGRPAP
ncbi:Toluene efflux pump periplasmic linker protein TtgD precursor [Aquisphaera giovannonii]|uniref:Toluene efflux pump periplasmic linker protein TtgD n=1 Tax=Aquisphaera giovannonii TaxID=406548 RepID=A0A5B9WC62_9BACT|nr:efflux RND transporter periplasmic adaptor subunit [Aquisphaera giovannonii]QEH38206.1 Toluene efflux pump periplasmic linker protein TtgD precursor [Aquisphaera giovannonii]